MINMKDVERHLSRGTYHIMIINVTNIFRISYIENLLWLDIAEIQLCQVLCFLSKCKRLDGYSISHLKLCISILRQFNSLMKCFFADNLCLPCIAYFAVCRWWRFQVMVACWTLYRIWTSCPGLTSRVSPTEIQLCTLTNTTSSQLSPSSEEQFATGWKHSL